MVRTAEPKSIGVVVVTCHKLHAARRGVAGGGETAAAVAGRRARARRRRAGRAHVAQLLHYVGGRQRGLLGLRGRGPEVGPAVVVHDAVRAQLVPQHRGLRARQVLAGDGQRMARPACAEVGTGRAPVLHHGRLLPLLTSSVRCGQP